MRVSVGPARRFGTRKTIYDKPIEAREVHCEDDRAILTICAEGRGKDESYRYELQLTPEYLQLLGRIG